MRKTALLLRLLLPLALLAAPAGAKNPFGNLKINKDTLKDVLKDTVKVAAIGFAIDKIAGPLNAFINQLMLTHGAENKETTKVVPILTVGSEGAIGAAQVCGPADLVDKVKAVIQFEDSYDAFGQKLRVRALVPAGSKTPLKIDRVYGVGWPRRSTGNCSRSRPRILFRQMKGRRRRPFPVPAAGATVLNSMLGSPALGRRPR
jgi:hypothetical protein